MVDFRVGGNPHSGELIVKNPRFAIFVLVTSLRGRVAANERYRISTKQAMQCTFPLSFISFIRSIIIISSSSLASKRDYLPVSLCTICSDLLVVAECDNGSIVHLEYFKLMIE